MNFKKKLNLTNLLKSLIVLLVLGTGIHLLLFSWRYIFQERKIDRREVESRRFDIDQNLYQQDKKFLEELREYKFAKPVEDLGNPFLP